MADAIRTTCPYCGVGCGILATYRDGILSVAGDPDHPANRGRLCVKGAALGETIGLENRLLEPRIGGKTASWDRALDAVAEAFTATIAAHGPEAVAFYVSGQLLTEDYYVANKLMKGFIGSANIDTNSRLCMASSVAGHARAFGSDTVPGNYEDLEQADLVVLVGSNAAWCHPVLFQRVEAAKAARPEMHVVVVDPRRTATADAADLHLALRPGSDAVLFNGLLAHLESVGAIDRQFVARHCAGLDAALEAARGSPEAAQACDLAPQDVATFFEWFARTKRTVTLYSQGINQSTSGTDKVNAIINCHLVTGRIGRPGMGPLSLTGQPNAMGGREVGGLANQLAAHMGFDGDARDRVSRFWGAPRLVRGPGLKAIELFQAIASGQVRAVWIMATNPAFSLPETELVRRGLGGCDFVAVSDCVQRTDTARHAHVLLPALAWAEKDGTVTNSERRISRQRAVLPPPGDAKPDWWIICEVAKRMGFGSAFEYDGPAAIFREHARLSAFENGGLRDFDIGGLIEADYETLAPVQWPVRRAGTSTERLFADGRFFHADGRARLVPVAPRQPAASVSSDWPLVLNTGRARDHWHSLSRSGAAPRLWRHEPEPWVSVHPDDATRFDLDDGRFARIESPYGDAVMRVRFDPRQRRGEIFAPMHWSDEFAARANVGRLIGSHTDPTSGQPELKCTPVRVRPAAISWEATLLARRPVATWESELTWSRTASIDHVAYRLAGVRHVEDWGSWVRAQIGFDEQAAETSDPSDWIEYQDRRRGTYRAAVLRRGRIEAVVFVGKAGERPTMERLGGLFAEPCVDGQGRRSLLANSAASNTTAGPVICACFQVGRPAILAAIASEGVASVEAIGRVLGAGTNCGSCVPELRDLLRTAPTAPRATPFPVNHRNKLVSEEAIR